MQNPERAALNNIDRRTRSVEIRETAEVLLPLHSKIASIMERLSPNMDNFSTLYAEEGVARDKRYVAERKRRFAETEDDKTPSGLTEKEVRNLAEILEFQIISGINMHNWIPLCRAVKTTEYDDIAHGVDAVVEFNRGDTVNHFGLGIDVSFSHNLQGKFQRIKDEID